jgi:hypothetical protein
MELVVMTLGPSPGCADAGVRPPLYPLRVGDRLDVCWSRGEMIPAPPIGISPEVGVLRPRSSA